MATLLDLTGLTVPYAVTAPTALRSTTARFSFTFLTTVSSASLTSNSTFGLIALHPRLTYWEVVLVKDVSGNVRVQLTSAVGVGPTVFSSILTWSANQPITVTLDFSVCSLTVAGATTGNGATTGTAFAAGSGTLAGTQMLVGARLGSGQSPPNWAAGSTLPGSISSVSDDAVTPVTHSMLQWAPYVWTSQNAAGAMQANNVKASSTHVRTTHHGAYLKLSVTSDIASGPVVLNYRQSRLVSTDGVNVECCLDGTTKLAASLTSASSGAFTMATSLSAGAHDLYFWIETLVTPTDRWTTPTAALEVTSIKLPPGVELLTPDVRPLNMLVYGDSTSESGGSGWYHHVAAALGCEVGCPAFGGQGPEENVAANNVPDFEDSWDNYDATQSRLVNGLLVPQPDYIIVNHGHNGTEGASLTAAIARTLAAISAAAPNARIILNVPWLGTNRASVSAAARPANCQLTDVASAQYLAALRWYTSDNVHPNDGGHGLLAAALLQKIRDAYAPRAKAVGARVGA